MRIFNTWTEKKEDFKPIKDGSVGMYVCGITVYDYSHVGHARSMIVFDVIYRYLKFLGYDVRYVRNFTDIDDKIINRANKEDIDPKEIAERFINKFNEDMSALGLEKPSFEPRVTENIPDIIKMVKGLIDRGYAYEVDGDVYYSVKRFKNYGLLSKKRVDELRSGARIDVDERKEDPLDFALWKKSKEGEPFWESPWGRGRPGWHIECSVMSMKYLGDTFDIHGGGMDLIFPHHENEIAQSEAFSQKRFARYWIHNGFVNINKEKMSKSLGNYYTIRKILNDYHPEVIRLFLLSNHYRSPIDFSHKGLMEADLSLERFYNTLSNLDDFIKNKDLKEGKISYNLIEKFKEAMDDDFNTALAIGYIFEAQREINRIINSRIPEKSLISLRDAIKKVGNILGIFISDPKEYLEKRRTWIMKDLNISEEEILRLIEIRNEARKNKDWAKADSIRNELLSKRIILEDTPSGTLWRVKRE
jgi:cysteinyl-tRNA synthetase